MRKNLKRASLPIILGICLAGIIILTACSNSLAPEPTQTVEVQKTQPQGQSPTQAPEDQLPTPGDQTGGYPSPSESSPPPLKTELQATNPSTVNLVSGDLQLVEFFAYW